jgi:hypothetical protein
MLTPGTGHVVHADARALPFPAATFDSALCDPPYELAFMGRAWDATGVAYNPATWREAARVLRPGGWLLAFGGTRTWHRLACAIEDAGLEIRDTIAWIYGSGYPKSRNSLKPAFEPIVVARKPTGGLASILNNLDIDGCGIGTGLRTNPAAGNRPGGATLNMSVTGMPTGVPGRETVGRWPSNLILTHMPTYDAHGQPNGDACAEGCVPGCPVAALDAQTGWTASNGAGGATPRTGGAATNRTTRRGWSPAQHRQTPRPHAMAMPPGRWYRRAADPRPVRGVRNHDRGSHTRRTHRVRVRHTPPVPASHPVPHRPGRAAHPTRHPATRQRPPRDTPRRTTRPVWNGVTNGDHRAPLL